MHAIEQQPIVEDEGTSNRCPSCGAPELQLTLVTTWFRYYRCLACGLVWSVARPGAPPVEDL